MWTVLIVFGILVIFSGGCKGYHLSKPGIFDPYNGGRCILLVIIFILLGVSGGILLYEDFGKAWLIPLMGYMGGAVPGMFLLNANGEGADSGSAWTIIVAPLGRYIISLFCYPIKFIKCFFGFNWYDPIF